MAIIADTLYVGDACIEIVSDDEAMAVVPGQEAWLWVVGVPGCACYMAAEHTYWGAFDSEDLLADALAAGARADQEFHRRKVT